MKRIILVAIAVTSCLAITFSSCEHYAYPKELLAADSICEHDYRTAVAAVDNLDSMYASFNKDSKWFYRLLKIKAKVKSYQNILKSDSTEVMSILNHYRHGGDKNLLPYAYYYAGCLYRDINNAPMAIEYFEQALDAMPDTTNLQLRSAINFRIGYLLLDQNVYDEAIRHFRTSYSIEQTRKDTAMMAYCLEKIALTFDARNNEQKAKQYYKLAYLMARKLKNKTFERRILASMSFLYVKTKEYGKADSIVIPMLNTVDAGIRNAFYTVAAQSRFYLGHTDDALFYCNSLLKEDDLECKYFAAKMLSIIYNQLGDSEKTLLYCRLYGAFADSLNKNKATEIVARMNASYNYNIYKKKNAELKSQNIIYLVWGVFLVVVIIVGCMVFIVLRKASIQRIAALEYTNAQISRQSIENIKEKDRNIAELKKKLDSSIQKTAEQIQSLIQQKAILEASKGIITQQRMVSDMINQTILESDEYRNIRNCLRKDKVLSEAEWKGIENLIQNIIPNFRILLYTVANISMQEYHLCLLLRMGGLTGKNIATLMGRSDSTVSKSKKKLQMIFVKDNSDISIEDYIVTP